MFVMATIYDDTGSAPVKVRDMSTSGALIEGPVIPTPGTQVRLSRGSINVTGKIAWSRNGRAGLTFASGVSVSDWMPNGRAPSAQQRVDEVVQQAKAGRNAGAEPSTSIPQLPSSRPTALELALLTRAVEALANDLADDPAFVERYGPRLQTLDLVAEALRRLATDI
jgi:hypothetical protein